LRCTRVRRLTLLVLSLLAFNGCGTKALDFCRPKPGIGTITPSTVKAGSADFALVIAGSDFHSDSVVLLNGKQVATTVQSGNQISGLISASDIAAPGTLSIAVFSPPGGASLTSPTGCGGGTSNTVMLTVTP
jgi:hypothetical protein